MNPSAKRILIVDNESDLTEVLKISLESLGGFHVHSENDPSRAFAAAREFAPDLIIMDIKMPELDGAGVVIQLKAEAALSETPIVFLTGTVTVPEIGRHGGKIGGLRFLPKTMPFESLVACLKNILSGTAESGATGAAKTLAA